jgi:hypothetical protein
MILFISAIGLFAIAAILGIYLLSLILRGKETRKGLAFMHGPVAAVGLVLLICFALESQSKQFILPITLLVAAAFGGFVLICLDLSGNKVPKSLALVHGLIAIAGVVTAVLAGT